MAAFICEGTYVKSKNTECIGKVLKIDKEKMIAIICSGNVYFPAKISDLIVLSYEGVM
jgi:hypothetical protein